MARLRVSKRDRAAGRPPLDSFGQPFAGTVGVGPLDLTDHTPAAEIPHLSHASWRQPPAPVVCETTVSVDTPEPPVVEPEPKLEAKPSRPRRKKPGGKR